MTALPRSRSLRARVLAAGLAVLTAALLAVSATVWLVQAAAFDQHLDDILDERIALALELAAQEPDHERLASTLAARGIRATVVGPDGSQYLTQPEVPRVGRNLPRPAGGDPRRFEVRAAELPTGGEVQVAVSRDGVDATLRRMLLIMVVAALIALPAAGLLLHRSSRVALRPLDTLTDTANSIADGDRTRRLEASDPGTELGKVAAAFNRMLDELQAAVDAAHASERATRRFLDSAAHQLQTPITAASTSAQALLYDPSANEGGQLALATSRETQRAGKIVADLLSLARLDAGLRITPARTAVGPLIDQEVERLARRSPHLVIIRDDGPERWAMADSAATQEILANLLDNAARHARQTITVTVTGDNRWVRLVVGDDGPGVPDGDEEAIFERFVSSRDGGAGLGLPIARELARLQGGDLVLDDGGFVIVLRAGPAQEPE